MTIEQRVEKMRTLLQEIDEETAEALSVAFQQLADQDAFLIFDEDGDEMPDDLGWVEYTMQTLATVFNPKS